MNPMVLLSVPAELLDEIGIAEDSIIQMSVSNGKLVIESIAGGDYACDGDCDACSFSALDCEGNCDICPCRSRCMGGEEEE